MLLLLRAYLCYECNPLYHFGLPLSRAAPAAIAICHFPLSLSLLVQTQTQTRATVCTDCDAAPTIKIAPGIREPDSHNLDSLSLGLLDPGHFNPQSLLPQLCSRHQLPSVLRLICFLPQSTLHAQRAHRTCRTAPYQDICQLTHNSHTSLLQTSFCRLLLTPRYFHPHPTNIYDDLPLTFLRNFIPLPYPYRTPSNGRPHNQALNCLAPRR